METAIECEGLRRWFSSTEAVRDLNLRVPAGSVFALLGPNGAGKTTTIKMMLDIIHPSRGRATILGVDSRRLDAAVLAQIGYVSENQEMPGWMRAGEFLNYLAPFYPNWDARLAQDLLRRLDIPAQRRIRALSRGMRVKLALASVLAYRPRLLVLDEPFSGLDPLVRDELNESLLGAAASDGATIFVSSHEIDEIEHAIDHLAFLDHGRLLLDDSLEALRQRFREVEVVLPAAAALPRGLPPEWLNAEAGGATVRFLDADYQPRRTERTVREFWPQASSVAARPVALRSLFVTLARLGREEAREEA